MRVLWLTNLMLPAYARAKGLPWSDREGWLSGCYDRVIDGSLPVELGVAFPGNGGQLTPGRGEMLEPDGVRFYVFPEDLTHPECYDPALESALRAILTDFHPDLVHVFGTEFPHTLALLRTCEAAGIPRNRVLISLQGICGEIAAHYMDGLAGRVQGSRSIRDRIRRDSLAEQQQKMAQRGEREAEALKLAVHVAGRTDFDRRSVLGINPSLQYHVLQETMRGVFYSGETWTGPRRPHTLFASQGDVPFKGLHRLLMAMPQLLAAYPYAHLYVAGNSVIGAPDRSSVTVPDEQQGSTSQRQRVKVPQWLKISGYGKYLQELIRIHHLSAHVTVLGSLSAAQMKEQLLSCETFVCPSTIENSPNSLAEAMLLGVPCVTAAVGGIPSMAGDGREALFFHRDEELTETILRLWGDQALERQLGAQARERALGQHDPAANAAALLGVYKEMMR
ncbi:MAG: glycosyltransferase [Butyrivibrio sp.]|nr:glycosyltransferase [Butyrivibrio sp.]